jgi:hypothetical protein
MERICKFLKGTNEVFDLKQLFSKVQEEGILEEGSIQRFSEALKDHVHASGDSISMNSKISMHKLLLSDHCARFAFALAMLKALDSKELSKFIFVDETINCEGACA